MNSLKKTASPLALALAAGLLLAGAPAAKAADMGNAGGDCCADLEERVATLEATTARTGNRKMSMKITGWVNAAVMWWSDDFGPNEAGTYATNPDAHDIYFDQNRDVYFVHNSTSQSRVNIEGSGRIRDGLSAGYSISIRPWGDKLSDMNQFKHHEGASNIDIRNTYVFLDHKSLGKLQLGLQDSAADGAWYQDLGGSSTWIANVNPGAWAQSFYLRDDYGRLVELTWGDLLQEMSNSQEPRLAYFSAPMRGFQVAASVGGDDTYALAAYYNETFGTVNVAAGIGYDVSRRMDGVEHQSVSFDLTDNDHTELRKLAMSGSIYDSRSGIYGTMAYSTAYSAVAGRKDPTNTYAKLGWRRDVTGMGETNIYAEYDKSTDVFADGISASMWGVGLVQDCDAVGAAMYLGYRSHRLDVAIGDPPLVASGLPSGDVPKQHFNSVLAGMVVQF